MDALTLMDQTTSRMSKIRRWFTNRQDNIKSILKYAVDVTVNRPGGAIFWGVFFLTATGQASLLEATIAGAIFYGMILLSRYCNHKIEKEDMELIDIDRIGLTQDPTKVLVKKSITELLGEYVEDCFNRDVIFFRPIKDKDFVDSKTERELLDELLDSAASNMDPLMRKKLGLYIGEDNVMKIVGRKCLTTITIFVAKHNHTLYDSNEIKIDADGNIEEKK